MEKPEKEGGSVSLPPRPKKAETETKIVADIRAELAAMPDIWLARNNSGKLFDRNGRLVSYGLGEGSSDLMGSLTVDVYLRQTMPNGSTGYVSREIARVLALEVKRPGEVMTAAQVAFGAMVKRRGGIFACVRSVQEAVDVVESARAWRV